MRNKLIKLLGGYTKDEVLIEAVKDLYNTIGGDDIFNIKDGEWYIGDKPLIEGEKKLLIAEASNFSKTRLWKLM